MQAETSVQQNAGHRNNALLLGISLAVVAGSFALIVPALVRLKRRFQQMLLALSHLTERESEQEIARLQWCERLLASNEQLYLYRNYLEQHPDEL